MARRADRARRRCSATRGHDARDDGVAPCHPRSGASGQDVGRDRPAQRRSAGRGCRARVVAAGLRRRRRRLRRTMGAARRVDRGTAAPVASRCRAVRRALLLLRRDQPRAAPDARGRAADLDRELGFGRRAPSRRPRSADGWLASAYNTTPELFREAWARLRGLLAAHGKDPGSFPNALGDDVVPHHREPRPRPIESCASGWCRRSTAPRTCCASVCRSARPSCSPRSSRRSRGRRPARLRVAGRR